LGLKENEKWIMLMFVQQTLVERNLQKYYQKETLSWLQTDFFVKK